jgi:hypothetical protein
MAAEMKRGAGWNLPSSSLLFLLIGSLPGNLNLGENFTRYGRGAGLRT